MNASNKINPFFYHRINTFPYNREKPSRFPAEFKLAFAYLASLHNKYERIYISDSSLNQTLGLNAEGISGEHIMKVFTMWGILQEHPKLFERSYYTLHEVAPDQLIVNALAHWQAEREKEAVTLLFGSLKQ
ncbi:hypothetical protein DH20_06800 [Pantoea agglomerans]|nr:hypothetical protein [Pantoea agglomerans]